MKSGIYLITCSPPDRLPRYYVGQSVDPRARWNAHKRDLIRGVHTNPRVQKAWNKYGPSAFSFEVLELLPEHDLDAAERWWLEQMVGEARCLNVLRDPSGGAQSGENHYAFGKRLTPQHRNAISIGCRGKKKSDATRAAISAATKGERNAMFGASGARSKRSKAVVGVSISDGSVRRYESACLAEADGFSQECISRCCTGKQKTHLGFVWSFTQISSF